MKRFLAIGLSMFIVLASLFGCANQTATEAESSAAPEASADAPAESPSEAPSQDALYTPGKYTGEGEGYGGKVVMEVEVDKNSILSINTVESSETAGISDPAFERVPASIIETQSIAVDTVSGATLASQGIIDAVKAALLSAGATEEQLMAGGSADASASNAEAIEMETEIVIIGGGAGYSAALEAIQAGSKVVVIDKMATIGGNTRVAGSAMNGADPEMQHLKDMSSSELDKIKEQLALEPHDEYMQRWQESIKADIDAYETEKATYLYDSPDLHKLQTYYGGDYVAKPELVEILGDSALESIQWLTSLGAGWTEDISAAVGATWPRSHMPDFNMGPNGSNFVLPQEKKYTELGGETYTEYKADKILMEGGRAVGVSGTTAAGAPFTIKASKGVILATGGFGANVEMRQKYNKHWASLDDQVPTSNIPAAQGDGIVMAEDAGANLIGMEWIQLVTGSSKGGFTASIYNNIYVNKDGDRFIREDARRDELSGAVLEQPDKFFWLISDGHTADDIMGGVDYKGNVIRDLVDDEQLFMADTIEELAEKIGADPVKFKKAVDDFNAAVDGAEDPFGRQLFEYKIDKAPFFAGHGVAMVHHTMGGVEINELCQVLDASGSVIPGFYAAGEVTGGIHGANRLGGNAITDIITFGRIAGQSAAAEK